MRPEMVVVCILLGVGFLSNVFIVWLIAFRLRDHLISNSYRFILSAKVLWALLCGSGIYLIVWPLPKRLIFVQLSWFSVLAVACTCSAIGFWIYTRDVSAILTSDSYNEPLPATAPDELHSTKERPVKD